ncbi:MAG: hypothetical protein QM769_02850 [Pseudoxanthomonas sp.]
MPTLVLTAHNIADFHDHLRSINVDVPSRSEGRGTVHVETYSIVRLLGSLPFRIENFPLTLVKDECPDYLLTLNGKQVGIEHTEAISTNAAKEAALRDEGYGPDYYFARIPSLHEPRKSRKQLIEEIEANKSGPGWFGDSLEKNWAEAMAYFIGKKVVTASKAKFRRFDQNWLLIYDNWPTFAIKHDKALAYLYPNLAPSSPWQTFNRIFILDEKILLDLLPTGHCFYDVNHCKPPSEDAVW